MSDDRFPLTFTGELTIEIDETVDDDTTLVGPIQTALDDPDADLATIAEEFFVETAVAELPQVERDEISASVEVETGGDDDE